MTPERINRLIARRNKLSCRRDERINWPALREIDDLLQQVPPGTDNRVDLALGRKCAQLPMRPDYGARAETVTLIEATRIIFEHAEPIEYQ